MTDLTTVQAMACREIAYELFKLGLLIGCFVLLCLDCWIGWKRLKREEFGK